MKTLRLAVLSTVVAVLTGCPGGGDKCKDVMCPTGQSCDSNTGMCVNGNAGGGTGGSGGNTGGGNNGGGSGGGTIDAGPPIPLSMLCEELAKAQCAKAERCRTLDTVDKATCIAVNREGCTLARDVNANVATYDGAAAAQCFARLALTDCSDDSTPEVCATAFVGGRGQAGSPCTASSNCQADAGLYCRSVNGCGTCTAFAGPGQMCNSSTSSTPPTTCRAGLNCSNSTDGGTCQAPGLPGSPCTTTAATTTNGLTCQTDAGFCPAAPTDGGARLCQPFAGTGQRCTTTSNCVSGNFCSSPGDGGASACEALRGADQPCTTSTQCQMGLFCPAATVTPRTCRALAADGTACTLDSQCASLNCTNDPFAYNDFDVDDAGARTCGFLAAGASCFVDTDCGPGSHCKNWRFPRPDAGYVFGQCATLDVDGGACVNSETRTPDSCANLAATCLDAKCVVTPPFSRMAGETCDTDTQCKWPSYCKVEDTFTLEGHCVTTYKDAGEECNFRAPIECGPGVECFFDQNTFVDVCQPFAHAGQRCDSDVGPNCTSFNDCVNADGGTDFACVPWNTVGGACSAVDFTATSCYASYCPTDAGTCQPRQANGAACTSTGQCASNRCINPDAGTADRVCSAACY